MFCTENRWLCRVDGVQLFRWHFAFHTNQAGRRIITGRIVHLMEYLILIFCWAHDKKGYPPKKPCQDGGHCFSPTASFPMYMWSLTSVQRTSTVFALPRYSILHIFTIIFSEQPNAQRPTPCGKSALLSEKPNVRTGKHICAPRACVLFKKRACWLSS